ncbi:phosphopantetheine-binding protein, partial [Myxococcus vastator]|uniref:phosphopantetheine-binding protein n=1 Tax=Myxococcus vastator TaxID=2709664 RepID=UPI001967AC6A
MKPPRREFECSTTVVHEDPLVRDHRVHGVRIMPGVVFLDLVLRALTARGLDTTALELRNILFIEPVATTERSGRRIRLCFTPQETATTHWQVVATSWPVSSTGESQGAPAENFRCEVHVTHAPLDGRLDVARLMRQAERISDVDDAYAYARGAAIEHLEFMKGQGQLYFHEREVLGALHLSDAALEHLEDFHLHPVFLDSATLLPFLYMLQRPELALQPFIPIHIESFRAGHAPGERVFVHVRQDSTGLVADDLFHSDLDFYAPDGQRIAALRKLSTKRIRSEGLISRLQAPQSREPARAAEVQPAAPAPSVLDYLRGLLATELQVDASALDDSENFYSQGLDSAHLLRLVRRLEQDLDVKLYPTLLFEHSTPRELADYLEKHHGAQTSRLLASPATKGGPP